MQIEIIAGDHEPDLPFVIVNRQGIHCDLTGIGTLWDPTVAAVRWGLLNSQGTEFGRISLKDGTSRNFFDRDLTLPYQKVWQQAWDAAAAKQAEVKAAEAAAQAKAIAALEAQQVAVTVSLGNPGIARRAAMAAAMRRTLSGLKSEG